MTTIHKPYRRVGLCGYSRSGKDTSAVPLINDGYLRHCIGDVIKHHLNALVVKHFGYRAFTEVEEEKRHIRPLLELWSGLNHDAILQEFYSTLPERAVNTKIVRVDEAQRWLDCGGILFEVMRPGQCAATEWEENHMKELRASGLIAGVILNSGSVTELHRRVKREVGL